MVKTKGVKLLNIFIKGEIAMSSQTEIAEKILALKESHKYYNTIAETQAFDNLNSKKFPPGYQYIIHNNKSHDVLQYFNIWMAEFIMSFQDTHVDQTLLEILSNFSKVEENRIRKLLLLDKTKWNKYLVRSHSTFMIEYNTSETLVTMSGLNVYSSLYENEEMLIYILWIAQMLNGDTELKSNFDKIRYRNGKGNINKTMLIGLIESKLQGASSHLGEELLTLFKESYNKKLRNIVQHNNANINHQLERIENIDNPKEFVEFKKFGIALYTLQQLHNHIKFFINKLLITENIEPNEGIILCWSTNEGLNLGQLYPFFNLDIERKKYITRISMVDKDEKFRLYVDNEEIICIEKDSVITNTFESLKQKSITANIVAIVPNIYDDQLSIQSPHGDYNVVDYYPVEITH